MINDDNGEEETYIFTLSEIIHHGYQLESIRYDLQIVVVKGMGQSQCTHGNDSL